MINAREELQSLKLENEALKETIRSLEKELERSKQVDIEMEWGAGSSSSWGTHSGW